MVSTMAVVSAVQNEDVQQAVQEAIELLGDIESFVHTSDKVLIKPNLVFALPSDTGFTTDPRVVKAIIEICRSMNPSEVTIAEGSGGTDTKMALANCGYLELVGRYDIKLVDLNKCQTTIVEVPNGKCLQELVVPNIIFESDVLINVPKLKLYKPIQGSGNWASLAVKNLLGAVPGKGVYSKTKPSEYPIELSPEFWTPGGKYFLPHHRQWWSPMGEKRKIHTNLGEGIVDLNTVIQPTLNIIDAIVVSNDVNMTYARGEPSLNLNTILASRDPLALDCIAAKIGRLDPFKIPYLKCAAERGIGESESIQTVGTPIDTIARIWESAFESSPA
jgi:uncharacterized protein (DUF362 family)